ncbi:unnamed protein product, partial [Medioppia subpectinata]
PETLKQEEIQYSENSKQDIIHTIDLNDGRNTQQNNHVSSKMRILLIVLLAMSISVYSAIEINYFGNSATYFQYLPMRLSAQTSDDLLMAMSATFTVGRLFSAFISSKLRPEIMLSYHLVIIGVSLGILFFGSNSLTMIWIGNILAGFGFAAMWSSYFAFGEKYIKLTDKNNSVLCFSSALLGFVTPFIIGNLVEKHPEVFIYLEFGYFGLDVDVQKQHKVGQRARPIPGLTLNIPAQLYRAPHRYHFYHHHSRQRTTCHFAFN